MAIRSTAIGSVAAGGELWGFVPPEFYGNFKRLRDNTQQINFPNVTAAGAAPKPYGIDGRHHCVQRHHDHLDLRHHEAWRTRSVCVQRFEQPTPATLR